MLKPVSMSDASKDAPQTVEDTILDDVTGASAKGNLDRTGAQCKAIDGLRFKDVTSTSWETTTTVVKGGGGNDI